jgi:hypothetical protein
MIYNRFVKDSKARKQLRTRELIISTSRLFKDLPLEPDQSCGIEWPLLEKLTVSHYASQLSVAVPEVVHAAVQLGRPEGIGALTLEEQAGDGKETAGPAEVRENEYFL